MTKPTKERIEKLKFHKYEHNGTSGACMGCGGYSVDPNQHDHWGHAAKINEIIDYLNSQSRTRGKGR